VKKPITQKKLRELLAQYYSENTDEAEAVGTFICENRGTTLRETVTRKALASENPKGAGAPA
jgi:hypothetical protein